MTQEEKKLLLKDLSARLPYGVFCVGTTYELDDDGERYIPVKVKDTLTEIHNYKLETASVRLGLIDSCKLETVKPYLRPMSSMTEEEKGELWFLLTEGRTNIELNSNGQLTTRENIELGFNYPFVCPEGSTLYVDWLNKHHFDYRGLIPMDLAIAVTKENNPYKE